MPDKDGQSPRNGAAARADGAADLRRLFLYTAQAELRPLTREFSPHDGPAVKDLTGCPADNLSGLGRSSR